MHISGRSLLQLRLLKSVGYQGEANIPGDFVLAKDIRSSISDVILALDELRYSFADIA